MSGDELAFVVFAFTSVLFFISFFFFVDYFSFFFFFFIFSSYFFLIYFDVSQTNKLYLLSLPLPLDTLAKCHIGADVLRAPLDAVRARMAQG